MKVSKLIDLLNNDSDYYRLIKSKNKVLDFEIAKYLLTKDISILECIYDETVYSKPFILEFLFNHGLVEEIIHLSKVKKERAVFKNFFESKYFYSFSNLRELLPPNDEITIINYSYLGNEELIELINKTDPDKYLSKYIHLYAECHARLPSDEIISFLSVKIRRPILNRFYFYFLKKYFFTEYLNHLVSIDSLIGNYILMHSYSKNEYTLTEGGINIVHSLIKEERINGFLGYFKYSEREKDIIQRICFEKNNFLPKYLSSLSKASDKSLIIDYAICISGQYRGGDECLPFWFDFADRNNLPLFITTWDNVGVPKSSHNNQLTRMLPDFLKPFFSQMTVFEFEQKFPSLFEQILKINPELQIKKLMKKYPNVEVIFDVYDELEFNDLSLIKGHKKNQSKMFFNIKNVLDKVIDYESDKKCKFKNIIWARPDFKIKKIKFNLIDDNSIYTSFTDEGGACGDFIFQFNRSYLNCFTGIFNFFESEIPDDYYFFHYDGPKLLGRVAHFHGLKLKKFSLIDSKFEGLKNVLVPLAPLFNRVSDIDAKKTNLHNIAKVFNLVNECNINEHDIRLNIKDLTNADYVVSWLVDAANKKSISHIGDSIKLIEIALSLRPQGRILNKLLTKYKAQASHEKTDC